MREFDIQQATKQLHACGYDVKADKRDGKWYVDGVKGKKAFKFAGNAHEVYDYLIKLLVKEIDFNEF